MLSETERKKAIKYHNKKQRLKNFMFSGIDWDKVIAISPSGIKFKHPK